ncbi:ParB N-terminal domain-containing protein [Streptomyces sp. SID161]|uniref:ParB/RepB/Spo0J family partition protein n=1 Tax=Streptomyces sp. SID161 TaxID=2690251 RepID=UPI00136A3D0F|nr:ParB N-terminal domain-containing protein [Streptomyces sp. SID161]MYW49630.1 ParB N-terminal domain-containing protein [Streptomyces sp. SID161]
MAGRRTSLASLAGQKVEDVPGRSDAVLLSLPLDKLHCTRFNPRRNFGTDEELREFGEKLKKEQLQPAVVVSRTAYLKLWPDEAERVGTALYVIANGERRYRASRLVGRPVLEVVHREDVAQSRASFLDAVQSENNDRQNLDPIERAIAIETMATELGGADRVAIYYGKSEGWVSQQRKLLKLTPALQDLVSAREMPVRIARDIAGLPADAQAAAWDEHLERRRLEKEAGARLRAEAANPTVPPSSPVRLAVAPAPPSEVPRFTAVNQAPPSTLSTVSSDAPAEGYTAVHAPAEPVREAASGAEQVKRAEDIPEPRAAAPAVEVGEPPALKRFPYDNGGEALQFLLLKMPPAERAKVLEGLEKDPETLAARVS